MKKKLTTTLDAELIKQIKIKALQEEKNVNDILEELISDYLKPTRPISYEEKPSQQK